MDCVRDVQCETKLFVVYSKIKPERKSILLGNEWILVETKKNEKNSADKKIKQMIENIIKTGPE